MRSRNVIVLFFYILISHAKSARILSLFPMPSSSHVILGYELSVALAKKGHEVTMVTPYPKDPKIDNFKEIFLKDLTEEMFKEKSNFFEMNEMSSLKQLIYCYYLGNMVIEGTFKDRQIQDLLNSSTKFDVVIMDQFYNEALLGIAHHFDAPLILSSSLESPMWTHHMIANPDYYSYVPNAYGQTTSRMNFAQRLSNAVLNFSEQLYRIFVSFPHHNNVLHQYLPKAPRLYDLMYNVSLVLVNSHVSITEALPRVPNMIDIAGMHIKKKNQLPENVKQFLDDGKAGVVYFSLGSNLKPSTLPTEKRDALLKAFSKLKQKVLWKWDDDNLPGQPDNVFIGKWFSQVDVLAHPNVKAFISHGGLLSTIEAINYGVPIIGIPVYADQIMNVERSVLNELAVRIDYKQLNEDVMSAALNEILYNPKYKLNAEKRSKLMQDRPMKPLDTAVYWVEYVIRHQGATHLRTAAMDLKWFQIHLLDILAFLLFVFVFSIYLLYSIIRFLRRKAKKQKNN